MTGPVTNIPAATKSRRALLAGALGGLGAVAAAAVGRVSPVRAANGDTVTVGNSFNGTANTTISTTSASAWIGNSSATGADALLGNATALTGSAWGVRGISQSATGSGVVGQAASTTGSNYGVQGSSSSHSGIGMFGTSPGTGVRGESFGAGTGVVASNLDGVALRATGRLKFSTSGVATINGGATSRTITPGVDINPSSFVLLTPKANIGTRALWFTTDGPNEHFTIHMSPSRGVATKVAWLLVG